MLIISDHASGKREAIDASMVILCGRITIIIIISCSIMIGVLNEQEEEEDEERRIGMMSFDLRSLMNTCALIS